LSTVIYKNFAILLGFDNIFSLVLRQQPPNMVFDTILSHLYSFVKCQCQTFYKKKKSPKQLNLFYKKALTRNEIGRSAHRIFLQAVRPICAI
jgi:hypothetical protein